MFACNNCVNDVNKRQLNIVNARDVRSPKLPGRHSFLANFLGFVY